MVGLGITRLDALPALAGASAGRLEGSPLAGGPASGPYSADSLRARAVEAALAAGDGDLAHELGEVCCWAPAATAIRSRPLATQQKGAEHFFRDFPGGEQLADVLVHANNTYWRRPVFRSDPESLVARHYEALQRPQSGVKTEVLTPERLNGRGINGDLGLLLDRKTGDSLAATIDQREAMWAGISIFSGIMLDPTDSLSNRLNPLLSLTRAQDRALARSASVRYTQIVLGAVQRAVWSDGLGGQNPALPLVQLTASGFLPMGEENGEFLLMRLGGGKRVTGYRSEGV
jgi:hypothetical protein